MECPPPESISMSGKGCRTDRRGGIATIRLDDGVRTRTVIGDTRMKKDLSIHDSAEKSRR
jgi:hypothetical protein